jgi:hypothetical protein
MARAQSRAICLCAEPLVPAHGAGRVGTAQMAFKTPTTTNEKARVHPASPAQDRGRQAMRFFKLHRSNQQCLIQVKVP